MKTLLKIAIILFVPAFTFAENKDSTLVLNADTSFRVVLHFFNMESGNESENNSILRVTHKGKVVRQDSLFCADNRIRLQDFNNDGVNDLLVFHASGARS